MATTYIGTSVDDLIVLIQDAGLATWSTDLFYGSKAVIPLTDGPFTSLIDTGGANPSGTHNAVVTGLPAYIRPSFQIVCRAEKTSVAMAKALALWNLLFRTGQRSQFINGTWWVKIVVKQAPFDLGVDGLERPRIAFNIDTEKRPSPATS